jgi:hypothetical protein
LPARRIIPEHAFALKKYRCGTSPVTKMSDNEHTPSSLGDGPDKAVHSDILRIENPVTPPIPELPQSSEEGTKIPSSVTRQDAGHILPENPSGAILVSDCKEGEAEISPWVSKSFAKSRD